MTGTRSLLARVRRLEDRRGKVSPFVRAYGSLEAFEATVQANVEAGTFDGRDMANLLASVRRWHSDDVWTVWT